MRVYKVKGCLFDQKKKNVQCLCLGQFLSNYKGWDRGFILGIHLHLGKTNRNQ